MIYLDNAATSQFKPTSMIDSMVFELQNSINFSRSSCNAALDTATKIVLFREKLLEYFNAKNHSVIFTPSCTYALNQAIFGYTKTFSNPIHVITTALEHNSTLRPIHRLYREKRVRYTTLFPYKDFKINLKELENAISPSTKLIVINHMSNVVGATQDIDSIKEIAKKHKITLIVDAAQSAGHTYIDMDGIDYLSLAGHKSLHGPQGIGVLIANNQKPIQHILYGGSGVNSENLDQDYSYPDSYEIGTHNVPAIIGLSSSFDFTTKNFELINNKIHELSNYLFEKLSSISHLILYTVENSPIISFKSKKFSSSHIANHLKDKDICIRSGLHCAPMLHSYLNTISTGLIRISLGFNNKKSDIDYLYESLLSL